MFNPNQGYYMINNGHANSVPITNLIEQGGMQYYGLYMLLFESTLLLDGQITDKSILSFCKSKGKMTEEEAYKFLDVCKEQCLIQPTVMDSNLTMYFLSEVRDYLEFAREAQDKRKEIARMGGLKKAENAQNENGKKYQRKMMASGEEWERLAKEFNDPPKLGPEPKPEKPKETLSDEDLKMLEEKRARDFANGYQCKEYVKGV